MKMKKEQRPVAFAALLIVAAACGDVAGGPDGLIVSDSAGVEVVRNSIGAPDTVEFAEPALRIGREDGSAEYLFDWVSDVEPLPGGDVVVLDNRGARVALFDSAGVWLRDFGGRGGGPGEYTAPLRAWQDGGELHVWDPVTRRLSRYGLDGTFAGSEALTWKNPVTPLTRLGEGWVDEREWGHQMEPGPAGGAIVRLGTDGATQDTIVGPYPVPRVAWEITDPATGSGHMVNPPMLSARPVWAVAGDRLYWSPGDEPRVDVYGSDGRHVRRLLLPRAQTPVTRGIREAHARGYQRRFGMPDEEVARMRDDADFASELPTVSGVLVDDADRIWIAEFQPGLLGSEAGHRWDVVATDGRILFHVAFPSGFQLVRVRDGRAYGVSTLPSGVHVVDVFDTPRE